MDSTERYLVVTEPDIDSITWIDLQTEETHSAEVASRPTQLLLDRLDRAWVSCQEAGVIMRMERSYEGESAPEVSVCSAPHGLGLSPDGQTLFVSCLAPAELVAMDTRSLEVVWRTRISPAPRGLTVLPDGSAVMLAHLTSPLVSEVQVPATDQVPTVFRFDLGIDSPQHKVETPTGAMPTGGRALVTSPFRTRVYAPHILINPELPRATAIQTGAWEYYAPPAPEPDPLYSAATPVVTTLRPGAGRIRSTLAHLPEDEQPGFGIRGRQLVNASNLPVAAAHSPTNDLLIVAMRGSHTVVAYRTGDDLARWRPVFLWDTPAGPDGIAIRSDGSEAYTHNSEDGSVSILSLGPIGGYSQFRLPSARISTGTPVDRSQVARGRRLFNSVDNTEVSGSVGVACAVCHPDGGSDGQRWMLPGGARNPPALAGRLSDSAPFNWLGDVQHLSDKVFQAVGRMRGTAEVGSAEVAAVVAYLQSLAPPPVAPVNSDELTLQVFRGEEIFHSAEARCADCHSGPMLTDSQLHDVSGGLSVDTPSLIGVGSSAPYFHDGRYKTLEEVFADQTDTMGRTSQLSDEDLVALIAYLERL